LLWAAKSFGGTLEWYVARELSRRLGFDVAAGVKVHARGVGGDDVVAAAEGKLAYLELKSSPPRNLSFHEVVAFFDRMYLLRPDVTLFEVDTGLRLSDKVLPMLVTELEHGRGGTPVIPRRIERELCADPLSLRREWKTGSHGQHRTCLGGRSVRTLSAGLRTRRWHSWIPVITSCLELSSKAPTAKVAKHFAV
jgi:hypothetical protein